MECVQSPDRLLPAGWGCGGGSALKGRFWGDKGNRAGNLGSCWVTLSFPLAVGGICLPVRALPGELRVREGGGRLQWVKGVDVSVFFPSDCMWGGSLGCWVSRACIPCLDVGSPFAPRFCESGCAAKGHLEHPHPPVSVYVQIFSALIVLIAGAFIITIIYRWVPTEHVSHAWPWPTPGTQTPW